MVILGTTLLYLYHLETSSVTHTSNTEHDAFSMYLKGSDEFIYILILHRLELDAHSNQ